MQTETPQPNIVGLEHLPMPPVQQGEHIPSLPPLEVGIERGADRYEQTAEASAVASDAAAAATAAVQVVAPVTPQDVSQVNTVVAAGPATAADDDVIEKEWVDKAKEIILATKDDPHARTSQVGQLQRDYLKKRFGKDVVAE